MLLPFWADFLFFILSFWSRLSVKHSEVAWLLYDNVALIYDLSIISGSDLTQKSPQTRQHLDLRRRNFCDKESIITKQNPDRNGTFTMNQLKEELEIIRLSIGTEYSDFRFLKKVGIRSDLFFGKIRTSGFYVIWD